MKRNVIRIINMILVCGCILSLVACSSTSSSGTPSGVSPDAGNPSSAAPAQTLNYPKENITFIIPFGAGGGTDITGRIFAQYLEKEIGTTIVIKNTTGGGGVVGFKEGATAKPDGYTMLLTTSSLQLHKYTAEVCQPYDELIHIANYSFDPCCLVVPADAPYNTLEEFVAYSLEHPGELTCTNSGTGAIWNVCALQFQDLVGANWIHVPYNSGNEAAVAVAGGHADFAVLQSTEPMSLVDAGELKYLAVATKEREESLPDVPTFIEQGYDFAGGVWRTVAVPLGTPDEIVDFLAQAMENVYNNPEFQDAMKTASCGMMWVGRDDVDQFLKESDVNFSKR